MYVHFGICVDAVFGDVIVSPMFAVVGDMIDQVLNIAVEQKLIQNADACDRVWDVCIQDNIGRWKALKEAGK